MTLVEVVAGLALLATVLSSILAVKTQVTRRSRVVAERREAVQAADELLAAWWQNIETFPRTGGGEVPNHPGLAWRSRVMTNPEASALGAEVVRLEVGAAAPTNAGQPLSAVEVLLPVETKDETRLHTR